MARNLSISFVARPGLLTCRARANGQRLGAARLSVMTEPDAVIAPSPTRDRGHQHGVRADEGALADLGAVLHHAVVVAGHGARADVGVLADMGVAEIGQVADLDAFVQDGVLDLDEVADMHILGQFRAGAQAGEGADGGPAADVAAFQMAEAPGSSPRIRR